MISIFSRFQVDLSNGPKIWRDFSGDEEQRCRNIHPGGGNASLFSLLLFQPVRKWKQKWEGS